MKIPNHKKCALVLKLNFFKLGIIAFFPNSCTLVILLQVDPTFGGEPKTVYKGFYKIEDTSIFAWFSIPDTRHYHWLCGSIH
jgi:hypothetical protein